jgi:hypothetical protein
VRWDFVEAALLRGDGETEIVGVERREKEKEKRKAQAQRERKRVASAEAEREGNGGVTKQVHFYAAGRLVRGKYMLGGDVILIISLLCV